MRWKIQPASSLNLIGQGINFMAIIRKQNKKREQVVLSKEDNTANIMELAKGLGLGTIPFEVDEFIRHLGVRIRREAMNDDVSGYLRYIDGTWVIGVNNLHHPRRQRFTLAHELAHYVLHKKSSGEFVDKVLFRSLSTDSPYEREANEFAANILMPEGEFRQFAQSVSKKIEDIAEHFDVSALAVRLRAKNLNFAGHGL